MSIGMGKNDNCQIFNFDNSKVRVFIDAAGNPWFLARDLCEALELKNPRQVVSRLEEDEKSVQIVDTSQGPRSATIVNESGMYSLIMTSRTDSAKKFRKWVTAEVLPQIRKTGRYGQITRLEALELAIESEKARIESERLLSIAESELNKAQPAIKYLHNIEEIQQNYTLDQVANHLGGIGRNGLTKFLRDKNILKSDRIDGKFLNTPYYDYQKWFKRTFNSVTTGEGKLIQVQKLYITNVGFAGIIRLWNRDNGEILRS